MENLVEEYYPDKGFSSDCLTLSPEKLEVTYKNYHYHLPLSQIQSIELKHIRLLFYYMVGGFTVTLTLIAVLKNFISPLYGISFFLAGVTCLYVGLKGKISLQISTTTRDYTFWFSGNFIAFQKFIQTVRQYILQIPTIVTAPPNLYTPESE